MYRITYIHKDSEIENPLYIPGDQDYCLTDAQLQLAMGKAGELNVYIPTDNPAREDIECLTDEVVFYRDDVEIWRGRPVTVQMDFDRTGQLTCEGILAYLYDTYFEPFEFEGSPKELLTLIINNHNRHVEERKQFAVGDVTIIDSNDYINRSSVYYDRSLNVMTEKLINDSLGGYFRVRIEDGVRYIDYLETYATQATQMVQYGENILDIATEVEYSDLATVILPLGARLEDSDGIQTDEYTTIASVNGGSIYYEDPGAVEEYGWICVCVEWEDVTVPSNLLDKGIEYLKQVTSAVQSFTVNAVDLSLISDEYDAINLGDYVYVRSVAHGINQYIELTEMTINPLAPENDVLQFGGDTATLTDAQRNSDRSVQSALGSLSMRVTNLTAEVINAVYANIEEIVASTITTDFIRAAVAELGYVTADWVEANFADIQYLEANYASIIDLDAAVANIELVNADVANILNVLAGNAGVGDLQAIYITAANAVIEDAVILDALMGTVLADIIRSNVIYTDQIKIMSEDGGITIIGNQMQIVDGQLIFYDESGVVRMQIGQDASGNFSFILYDETGTGIMIDSEGVHESAIPDGLIVDQMVAEDANISASKLNIEELTSVLNANGDLVLSAEQITIGGGTLDYTLTEITEQIANLEEMEGVDYVENWYALSSSPDYYPPLEFDDSQSAVLGVGILGEMILGVSEANWSTIQPAGDYVWFVQKIVYVDGSYMWTTPTLLTDEALKASVTIQQTELEVVQGQIEARIWQTDIDDAISEQYAAITMLIDTIDLRVATLTTTVDTLESSVAAITLNLDSITAEVREVYEINPLIEGVPYYAVSYDPGYYPPFEWESDQSAVLGEAILGLMVLGATGSTAWTTEQPEYAEGQYIWIAYLRTRLDGTTYWTEPTLLTDEYLRESVTEMSERYAQIVISLDGIREEVVNVQTELAENYSTTKQITAVIEAAVSDSESTILQEVAYTYVTQATLEENYYDYAATDALIQQFADSTSASIMSTVSATYATKSELSDYATVQTMEASIEQYVSAEMAKISLSVSGSLGGTASITLTTDAGSTSGSIDLKDVRTAFADDKTAIAIDAGTITFNSNTLVVNSNQFTLDRSGNATFSGVVTTTSGNYKTVMDGGYLDFYYSNELVAHMYASASGNMKFEEITWLVVGSTSEKEYRYVRVQNASAIVDLRCSYDNQGTVGVYSDGGWICAKEINTSTNYFGNGDEDSVIRGKSINVNSNLSISGAVTTNSSLTATGAIITSSYLRAAGNIASTGGSYIRLNDQIELYTSDSEYGLHDYTYNRWLVAVSSDGYTYCGNNSVRTYLRGNGVQINSAAGINMSAGSSGNYLTVTNDDGTIRIVPCASYSGGYRKGLYDSDSELYIIQRDGNYQTCVGNSTWNTVLYGANVTLASSGAAVTSDRQFKDNITPFEPKTTDNLTDKLAPKIYTIEDEPETKHIGFIVDEVEDAMRAAGYDPDEYGITTRYKDEDGNELGAIRYDEFIPILLYEIQELRDRVNALENPEEGLIDPGIQLN